MNLVIYILFWYQRFLEEAPATANVLWRIDIQTCYLVYTARMKSAAQLMAHFLDAFSKKATLLMTEGLSVIYHCKFWLTWSFSRGIFSATWLGNITFPLNFLVCWKLHLKRFMWLFCHIPAKTLIHIMSYHLNFSTHMSL